MSIFVDGTASVRVLRHLSDFGIILKNGGYETDAAGAIGSPFALDCEAARRGRQGLAPGCPLVTEESGFVLESRRSVRHPGVVSVHRLGHGARIRPGRAPAEVRS